MPDFDARAGEETILSTSSSLLVRTVHDLDKLVFKRIADVLDPNGLSQTQALFIIYLGYNTDEAVYQSKLEKAFGLSNPTVTASIRSLVKKGVIYREQDKHDGRFFQLFLTDYGKTLYAPCIEAFQQADEMFGELLSPEEVETFRHLIQKLLQR